MATKKAAKKTSIRKTTKAAKAFKDGQAIAMRGTLNCPRDCQSLTVISRATPKGLIVVL
jgi:hypothetical protein